MLLLSVKLSEVLQVVDFSPKSGFSWFCVCQCYSLFRQYSKLGCRSTVRTVIVDIDIVIIIKDVRSWSIDRIKNIIETGTGAPRWYPACIVSVVQQIGGDLKSISIPKTLEKVYDKSMGSYFCNPCIPYNSLYLKISIQTKNGALFVWETAIIF